MPAAYGPEPPTWTDVRAAEWAAQCANAQLPPADPGRIAASEADAATYTAYQNAHSEVDWDLEAAVQWALDAEAHASLPEEAEAGA